MSNRLIERLGPLPANVTSVYHKNKWTPHAEFPTKTPSTQLAIESLTKLVNPRYPWIVEAYRINRLSDPQGIEAVFFSEKPPTITHEVPVKISKTIRPSSLARFFGAAERTMLTSARKVQNFLDLENALNPEVLSDPILESHYENYRPSPSGLTLEGVTIFPILSLKDHIQQALEPDPNIARFPYAAYIPFIFARTFPFFDITNNSNQPVGENRKRMFIFIALKDVRPVLSAVALDRNNELAHRRQEYTHIKTVLEEKLAQVKEIIEDASPQRAKLEGLAYDGYIRNLKGKQLNSG